MISQRIYGRTGEYSFRTGKPTGKVDKKLQTTFLIKHDPLKIKKDTFYGKMKMLKQQIFGRRNWDTYVEEKL